jgi:hypothetical protein
MRRLFSSVLFFSRLSLFVRAQSAPDQEPPKPKPPRESPSATTGSRTRPKIGVALEGGGALGLAHIGVLQWFEEHHTPVDYIAGTSMGGLVASLYATGKVHRNSRQSGMRKAGTSSLEAKSSLKICPSAARKTAPPIPTRLSWG